MWPVRGPLHLHGPVRLEAISEAALDDIASDLGGSSAGVNWRLSLAAVIITHLVTRASDFPGHALSPRASMASGHRATVGGLSRQR